MAPTPVSSGRFVPGTLLSDRYRIVALQGRGGMGEVYRVDDLRLGETVALKFLPEHVEHDEALRQRLIDETRNARKVSHPNACRVYDVGEVDGRLFLTMEYVDGEDLGSLLRRIGRLPRDKALQVARELCTGLQAVHDAGVLHRDLKPSNVMIDGRGRARIADFGVAAIVEGVEDHAGTPAYMAPEQLAGKPATVHSDVYSLGLVLYEVITGRRAFPDGPAPADGSKRSALPATPSSVTPDVDPSVERAIMRCLETDPSRRPATPLAVAIALPGGDPLAAARAAGETPSPDIVAGAADYDAARPAVAWGAFAAFIALLAALFALAPRAYLVQIAPIRKQPAVLTDRALEIRRALGYDARPAGVQPRFSSSFSVALREVQQRLGPRHAIDRVMAEGASLFTLNVRTSPLPLVPLSALTLTTSERDPPHDVPGMCDVWVDGDGRLTRMLGVAATYDTLGPRDPGPAFAKAFELAGLDSGQFHRVAPRIQPAVFSDARGAWLGRRLDRGGAAIRVEAATANGRLVSFVAEPSDRIHRTGDARWSFGPTDITTLFMACVLLFVIVLSLIFARRQLAAGRADVRTAARLIVVFCCAWLVTEIAPSSPSLADGYVEALISGTFSGLCMTIVLFVGLYLTLEPILRRTWPESLVSWIRLGNGRLVDARVGRDGMAGLVTGLGTAVVLIALQWGLSMTGLPQPTGARWDWDGVQTDALTLGGWPIGVAARALGQALTFGITCSAVLALVTRVTGRRVIGMTVALLVSLVWLMGTVTPSDPFDVAQAVLPTAAFALLFVRFGLLSVVVSFFTMMLTHSFPFELPGTSWYWNATAVPVTIFVALAAWSFVSMFGGRPVFVLPRDEPAAAARDEAPISQRETAAT